VKWEDEEIDKSIFELSSKAKKLLKYYPNLRNEDVYLNEFNGNGHTVLESNKPLNPEYITY